MATTDKLGKLHNTRREADYANKIVDAEHVLKTKLMVPSDDVASRLVMLSYSDVEALKRYVVAREYELTHHATEAVAKETF